MDSSHIELKGSTIESVDIDAERLSIRFSHARIIKTMTGSKERTLWRQAADLVIEGTSGISGLPTAPSLCMGGDVEENVYTYRDMIPIPLESRGRIHCLFKLDGQQAPLEISGSAVKLALHDAPQYIKHIRPGETD